LPSVNLQTLGCRLNQAETAIIAKRLTDLGFQIVDLNDPADLAIINTCTITEQADAKCRQAVRRALRRNPEAFVAVIGCYAQIAAETISQIQGVDLIVGNEHKLDLASLVDGLQKRESPLVIQSDMLPLEEFVIDSVGLYDFATRANVKLQDGCNYRCAYCIIPKVRGRARSRRFDDVIREAKELGAVGHKEIVLTGINIGTYKSQGKRLPALIEELERIDSIKRIRVSSIEPTTVSRDLILQMASSEKLCRHLHIPLQSGDDSVLKRMKRRYTAADFAEFLDWTLQTVPDIGLGTDVLVGFPGEGEEQFARSKKMIGDLPLAYFHVFTYSDRPHTRSDMMPDKVPPEVKKLRTRVMIEMGLRKQYAFYERHLGRTIDVLFENRENGYWLGFADNYIRVQCGSSDDLHNQFRRVKLQRIDGDRITGTLVD
jgi:threonylcarbamoyladenosine tRNA methylthiotransferase MtaB